jgi:hypothetical protein
MRTVVVIPLALTVILVACERAQPVSVPGATSTAAVTPVSSSVAKIVFIDQEEACDCTHKRIADTWSAMQTALGTPPRLPVERIHLDTQAAQANAYTALKPLMVPPGIYFVDERNTVVEMLQGEVKTEQVAAVLAR